MLTVAAWKWRGTREYTSEHVNVLFRAVADNLHIPHRFVCITDDPVGLDDNINVVELPDFDHIEVRPGFPSSYVRLLGFCPEFSKRIGDRILTLDIDVVVMGDLTPLVERDEEFVGWSDPDVKGLQYHGGMYLMDAGCRPQVWETFDREMSPKLTKDAGLTGSDQAWISYCLWPNEAIWEKPNGIYRTRNIKGLCPDDARIVQFPGHMKPWFKMCEDQHPDLYAAWSKYANIRKQHELPRWKDNASSRGDQCQPEKGAYPERNGPCSQNQPPE